MVGTARGAEPVLHVALHTSQFRLWVRDYGMPASQSGRLHHQINTVVSQGTTVFLFVLSAHAVYALSRATNTSESDVPS